MVRCPRYNVVCYARRSRSRHLSPCAHHPLLGLGAAARDSRIREVEGGDPGGATRGGGFSLPGLRKINKRRATARLLKSALAALASLVAAFDGATHCFKTYPRANLTYRPLPACVASLVRSLARSLALSSMIWARAREGAILRAAVRCRNSNIRLFLCKR